MNLELYIILTDHQDLMRLHVRQYLLHQELVGGFGATGATGPMGVTGATARHVASYVRVSDSGIAGKMDRLKLHFVERLHKVM